MSNSAGFRGSQKAFESIYKVTAEVSVIDGCGDREHRLWCSRVMVVLLNSSQVLVPLRPRVGRWKWLSASPFRAPEIITGWKVRACISMTLFATACVNVYVF
jgi:hypothetical protein